MYIDYLPVDTVILRFLFFKIFNRLYYIILYIFHLNFKSLKDAKNAYRTCLKIVGEALKLMETDNAL